MIRRFSMSEPFKGSATDSESRRWLQESLLESKNHTKILYSRTSSRIKTCYKISNFPYTLNHVTHITLFG